MKSRIAIWAAVGALVVTFWRFYISATLVNPQGFERILVNISCPIAIAGNHPQTFYFVLAVNAATYGLVGMIVEFLRRPRIEAA
jgi:hypothetical protein